MTSKDFQIVPVQGYKADPIAIKPFLHGPLTMKDEGTVTRTGAEVGWIDRPELFRPNE